MSKDKPKPKPRGPRWTNARPATLGDVLGEALRAEQARKARRAELDAAGFKPLENLP